MKTPKKSTKYVLIGGKQVTEDEVTDTIGDILETTAVIDTRLSDGFQPFEDLIAISRQQDDVRDMVNSFPAFIEQFKNLSPELAISAVAKAEERAKKAVGGQLGRISQFVVFILRNAASNYAFVRSTIDKVKAIVQEGEEQLNLWKTSPL